MPQANRKTKHRELYDALREEITEGALVQGDQLPTEKQLAESYQTSRPTAARALNDLAKNGFISRRAGAGSFVLHQHTHLQFGLFIPGLGATEIFEPVCGAIASAAESHDAGLLWGPGTSDFNGDSSSDGRYRKICRYFLDRKVDGVFFAPAEFDASMLETNKWVIDRFREAEIPVILLDRDYLLFPQRSRYDLVGINNYRAGYVLTHHLIQAGARRLEFVARLGSASTIDQRIGGYRQAILDLDIDLDLAEQRVHIGDPEDAGWVSEIFDCDRPDGIICANDITAGEMMNTLGRLGIKVPVDVRLGSFDDVKFARLLSPSLTTIHQPCSQIGQAAFHAMMARIAEPHLPPREISLEGQLIIRESSGISKCGDD